MTGPITGWIMDRNLRGFLDLLSHHAGCAFDETDWETVEAGVQDTDDEAPDGRYSYPLVGTDAVLRASLARAVGGQEVSVRVTGAGTPELRLRTDTLLSASAAL
ncbi:hypothetical protein ACFUN7_15200 [Streptomyces sp. NPDC057236]|uniref:hypothetical protein n=1 Tax=Streptomyces sp. NPDC057236 TaxID=3346059 RepID=UPI003635547D